MDTETQGHSSGNDWMRCKHDMCGGMCGHHHWKHIVIKILVALFIFWCGVQFGELKSVLHAGYYSSFGNYGGGGYGMMRWAQ